jgi:hypothetical protein
MSAGRFERLRLLVLGAGVALVASCGSATVSGPDADAQPPVGDPTASATDEMAVTTFVHRLRRERVAFEPAADWRAGRLILAVPHPMSAPWPGVSGQLVGGLKVTVVKATVTPRDYERAIPAIGRATFADSDRVESFSYPTDGSHITVRVRSLRDMDTARRAALAANLERIAGVPVQLVNAPHLVYLPYVATK